LRRLAVAETHGPESGSRAGVALAQRPQIEAKFPRNSSKKRGGGGSERHPDFNDPGNQNQPESVARGPHGLQILALDLQ
jgi:hypothetical protein